MHRRYGGFRILSHDEFDALTTRQRIDYLREAIAALEEFKGQLRDQIIADTAAELSRLPPLNPDQLT